jgi:hypothetical protein
MAITMTRKANGVGENSAELLRRLNQSSRTNQIVLAVGRVLRGVEEVEETVVLHLQHKTSLILSVNHTHHHIINLPE